jgi:hypothetical protein
MRFVNTEDTDRLMTCFRLAFKLGRIAFREVRYTDQEELTVIDEMDTQLVHVRVKTESDWIAIIVAAQEDPTSPFMESLQELAVKNIAAAIWKELTDEEIPMWFRSGPWTRERVRA